MKLKRLKLSAERWTPHNYQKKAVKFLLGQGAGALFLDPGLGKTSITLAALKILFDKKLINKVLLIAPLRVCHSVWPIEVKKWADFNHLRTSIMWGPKKDEALEADADIYIINPEGLEWLTQCQKTKGANGKTSVSIDLRRWKKLGFDCLVIDELSKFKATTANRFKIMKHILPTFQRRYGLTGSPASNGLEGLFGQMYMLDMGRTLGAYITHYRNEFFHQGYSGFGWELNKGAEEKIYERVAPMVLRMAAEDHLELPALVENTIEIEMPPKIRAIYETMEDDLFAVLGDKEITAATAGAAMGKLWQIAQGFIYRTPEVEALVQLPKSARETHELHDLKIEALSELIDELQGQPLLVAYQFQQDLEAIIKKFGKNVPYIGTGVKPARAKELEAMWNAGELPYLFGHPMSIGHGLNLQEAGHHVAWYAMNPDYELYDQFNRRVLRQGNTSKRVFVHHLVMTDTVDEVFLSMLKTKRYTQGALFTALKKLQSSRK